MSKKILSYLQPNFSRHWGNWILAPIFAFFIGFLPFSVFAASVGDIFYTTGAGYPRWTADESCAASAGWRNYSHAASGWCYHTRENGKVEGFITYAASVCGDSQITDPTHICYGNPPSDCPETGTVVRMTIPTTGSIVDGVFVSDDGSPFDYRNGSYDGCGYAPTYMYESSENTQPDYEYACSDDGQCIIIVNMAATGEESANDSSIPSATPLADLETEVNEPGPQPETTETVYHEPTTEILPDGTVVDVESHTTTTVRGAGTDTVETEEQTVFKQSDGVVKTETKTTIEKTHSDGSKTVTEDVSYSYTGHGGVYTVMDNGSGTMHQTTEPTTSASGGSTTTTNYDSDGNKTSSSTTSQNTGNGSFKNNEDQAAFCQENPENVICKEWNGETESDAEFATDDTKTEVEAAWLELKSTIETVQSDIRSTFSTSTLSGQGLGCYSFIEFRGHSFEACLGGYTSMFAQLGTALVFLTMLLILYMLLKD